MAVLPLLILMMIFMSGCKQNRSSDPSSLKKVFETKDTVVIDCLGDSITWGMYSTPALSEAIESGEIETGLDDGGQLFEDYAIYISGSYQSDPSYPEVLETELNRKLSEEGSASRVTTVNDGICGDWVTMDSYKRMTCDPDVVILFLGGNNYYFDYPIDGCLEKNIRALREQGKVVYLANYPLFPGETHEDAFYRANEKILSVAESEHVPLIDFWSSAEAEIKNGTYKREDLFSPDRIHLSEEGYRLIGEFAAERIFKDLMK